MQSLSKIKLLARRDSVMTYAIGNIVLGTYAPWDREIRNKLIEELGEDFQDEDPWEGAYHGSSEFSVAWVGVVLQRFDECDNFPLAAISQHSPPSRDIVKEARHRYEQLPVEIRKLLPPFGIYVVWSSS
jgi:hypothetical protein